MVVGREGGQGGCERRIEIFVKIQKKIGGGGVRVDVNEENGSFCENSKEDLKKRIKKLCVCGWVGSGGGGGGGSGGQRGCE